MDIVLERMLSLIPRKPDGKFVHGAKKEFCKAIGAPDNIVGNWLGGVTKSYRNYVYAAAAAYNVSADWILGKTDIKKTAADPSDGLSEEETQFIQELRLMSEEERKFLMAQIRGVNASRD